MEKNVGITQSPTLAYWKRDPTQEAKLWNNILHLFKSQKRENHNYPVKLHKPV